MFKRQDFGTFKSSEEQRLSLIKRYLDITRPDDIEDPIEKISKRKRKSIIKKYYKYLKENKDV